MRLAPVQGNATEIVIPQHKHLEKHQYAGARTGQEHIQFEMCNLHIVVQGALSSFRAIGASRTRLQACKLFQALEIKVMIHGETCNHMRFYGSGAAWKYDKRTWR